MPKTPPSFNTTRQRAVSRWDCLGQLTGVDRLEVSGFVLTPHGYVFCLSREESDGTGSETFLDMVQGGKLREWGDDQYRSRRTLASLARAWAEHVAGGVR